MTTELTDNELLDAFAATGEQRFFNVLVKRYTPMLMKVAKSITKEVNLAEDAVQATLLALSTKHDKFNRRLALGPWLKTIAANHSIDLMRSRESSFTHSFEDDFCRVATEARGTYDPPDADLPTPDETAEALEMAERLRTVVHTLAERDRNVIEAIYFEGLTALEASVKLGMPVGSISTCVTRALRLMKIRLARAEHGGLDLADAA